MSIISRKVEKNGFTITYFIERKKIKNLYMRYRDGDYYVTCPYGTDLKIVDNFVLNSYESLYRKVLKHNNTVYESLDYSNETNEISYLGKKYKVYRSEGRANVYFDNGLYLFGNPKEQLALMKKFFLEETKRVIEELYLAHKKTFDTYNLVPKEFVYKYLKSKWGSCLPRSRAITFNASLSKLDVEIIYYILCHELAHIAVPNHGEKFHLLLEALVHNHKLISKRLKKYYL